MLPLVPTLAGHSLHPSVLRAWRLPGTPEDGMIVRVLECEYTAVPFVNGLSSNSTEKINGDDLQSCLAEELSSWYRSVPATSVYPDNDDLFFSYTNVLGKREHNSTNHQSRAASKDKVRSEGERVDEDEDEDDVHDGMIDTKDKTWLPAYPAKRLIGLILSNDASIDEAYPHDAWSTSPGLPHFSTIVRGRWLPGYPPCNGTRPDYAEKRLENTLKRCALLHKHPHNALQWEAAHDADLMRNGTKNTPYMQWRRYRRFQIAEKVQFAHWVESSKYTCYHKNREDAETEQRAYLDLLVANGTTCESGPLYNQLQVRYTMRMVTGVFYTPELRKEAMQVRDAIHAIRRTFGANNAPLNMIEAVRTENYPPTLKDFTGDDVPTGDELHTHRRTGHQKLKGDSEQTEPEDGDADDEDADAIEDSRSWNGALQPEPGPW
jgi:hypothetical protein